MTDVYDREKRRAIMQAVRGKDTQPEMVVRRLVHGLGYRYRLHESTLPGKPDLVFPRRRKVIFVHGCFWHRHSCPRGRSLPRTRFDFWQEKLESNLRRDRRNQCELRRRGWSILIIWECRMKLADRKTLMRRIIRFLED